MKNKFSLGFLVDHHINNFPTILRKLTITSFPEGFLPGGNGGPIGGLLGLIADLLGCLLKNLLGA